MRSATTLLFCLLAAPLSASTPGGTGDLPATRSRGASEDGLTAHVHRLLEERLAEGEFPGAAIALRDTHGRSRLISGGVATILEPQSSLDPRVPLSIGSVTKTFIAIVTLQLVQEGRFGLDDSVLPWVPTLPGADRITIRHLLQHRSGLGEYLEDPAVLADARRPWTADELIQVAVTRGVVGEVGGSHAYSNTNYLVLGQIIERVTGRPWSTEVRRRILDPLGMEQTGYPPERSLPASGPGHRRVQGEFVDATGRWHPSLGGAAGALQSTPEDLLRFAVALEEGQLLSGALLKEMQGFHPAQAEAGVKQEYGLGLQRYTFDDMVMVGHLGSAAGTSSFVGFDPESRASVAVLVNREHPAPAAFLAADALRASREVGPAEGLPREDEGQLPDLSQVARGPSAAQGNGPAEGFHGSFQLLLGAMHRTPSGTDTFETDRQIGSVNDPADSQTDPIGDIEWELSYTFEGQRTQVYAGATPIASSGAKALFELGLRQQLPDGSRVTLAYAPSIASPLGEVWEDPFQTGQPRRKTDMEAGGVRLAVDQPLGLPLTVEYQYAQQSVENERSGVHFPGVDGQGLADLRRDGDYQRLDLSTSVPLVGRWMLWPRLALESADADGRAHSFEGWRGSLGLGYGGDGFDARIGTEVFGADYDGTHPVFGRVREDEGYEVSLGCGFEEPFGWKSTRLDFLLSFSETTSNIGFYEEETLLAGMGLTYRF